MRIISTRKKENNMTIRKYLLLLALGATLTASAQSNGYYRLKNKATGEYASLASDVLSYNTVLYDIGARAVVFNKTGARTAMINKMGCYLEHDIRMTTTPNTVPASVFYLKSQGSSKYDLIGEGTSLKTITNGSYTGGSSDVNIDGYYVTIQSLSGSTGVYTLHIPVSIKYGLTISLGDYYFKSTDGNFGVEKFSKQSKATENAQWYLEPATTFNVSCLEKVKDGQGHYYTTLCVDFPFTIPASGSTVVAAYTVTGKDSEGYAVMNEITSTIPGGTPVILECTSPNAETNILNIATSTEPASKECADGAVITSTGNYLQGRYFNAPSASYSYLNTYKSPNVTESLSTEKNVLTNDKTNFRVLNCVDGKVGFYKLKNASTTMAANKAFLNISGLPTVSSIAAKTFALDADDETTDIHQAVTEETSPTVIYDLQGRRVAHPTAHGIYIVNGKKVVL